MSETTSVISMMMSVSMAILVRGWMIVNCECSFAGRAWICRCLGYLAAGMSRRADTSAIVERAAVSDHCPMGMASCTEGQVNGGSRRREGEESFVSTRCNFAACLTTSRVGLRFSPHSTFCPSSPVSSQACLDTPPNHLLAFGGALRSHPNPPRPCYTCTIS